MALKTLMLRREINLKRKELEELRKRGDAFQTRETELEADIEAAETEEQRTAVNEAVEQFEKDKADHEEAVSTLAGEIDSLERELEEAIAAAQAAFPEWSQTSLSKRTQMMFKWRDVLVSHLDELTVLCAKELGKNLNEARGDILKAIEPTELACATPFVSQGSASLQVTTGFDTASYRVPLGVVAGIVTVLCRVWWRMDGSALGVLAACLLTPLLRLLYHAVERLVRFLCQKFGKCKNKG